MSHHTVSKGVYYLVFAALLILTALTAWVAFIDLGVFSNIVTVGIACVKATLVILFFMHVKYSSKLTWAFVSGAFVFLLILLIFTLGDFLTRGMVVNPQPW